MISLNNLIKLKKYLFNKVAKGIKTMNMNPKMLMQLQQRLQTFQQDHPKFLPFLSAVKDNAVQEGSVFAVKVTTPDGRTIESNIRLTANDIETIRMMSNPDNQS